MKTRILIITSLFFLFCGCTKKNLTDESTTSKITPVVVNQDSNPSENKLVDELLVKKDLELFDKEDDYRLLQNENDISDKFNGPFTSLYMYEIEKKAIFYKEPFETEDSEEA